MTFTFTLENSSSMEQGKNEDGIEKSHLEMLWVIIIFAWLDFAYIVIFSPS